MDKTRALEIAREWYGDDGTIDAGANIESLANVIQTTAELEADLWKERSRQLIILLIEARNRLDQSHSKADVCQWIDETIETGWMAEVKRLSPPKPSRLIAIEAAYNKSFVANFS